MGEAQDAFIIFDEAYEGNDVDAFYLGKFHSSFYYLERQPNFDSRI